jgi:hypothetical protein
MDHQHGSAGSRFAERPFRRPPSVLVSIRSWTRTIASPGAEAVLRAGLIG